MAYALHKPNLWRYFKGAFLYRVNERYTKSIKILMAVVIDALIFTGLYFLFGNTILPTLTQRIKEMFNYAG